MHRPSAGKRAPIAATVSVARPRVLIPIGGGYDPEALQGFLQAAIASARPPAVSIAVIPSAYAGNHPEDAATLKLADARTRDIRDRCDAVISSHPSFTRGCTANLLSLFDRSQAGNPANSAALGNASTGGAFLLGGDQDLAMESLAGTAAESAMAAAYARGMVLGGTSAGAEMQSKSMIAGDVIANGYSAAYGLRQDAVTVWWADAADGIHRGLSFGSNATIIDSHVDERGRLGRLLNVVAQSAEHFGAPRLGVGMNYQTGTAITNDATISGTFGDSSAQLVDFGALNASHSWVGPNKVLSARNVVTHLMAPGDGFSYNIAGHTPTRDHRPVPLLAVPGWSDSGVLRAPGSGTLILGGDLSTDFSGAAMQAFVSRARATGLSQILVVTAGYENPNAAQSAANSYASGLNNAGWKGTVETVSYSTSSWPAFSGSLAGAAGVIFAGGDQSALTTCLADARFVSLVRNAVAIAPVVLADHAMAAAFGSYYDALPDPTAKNLERMSTASYGANNAQVATGLGILPAAFEPRLTVDQRWGRLYGLSMAHPETIVFGIGDGTAIVIDATAAHAIGAGSVVALDGRAATFGTGSNGAISAYNVIVDTFGSGDEVTTSR